MSWAHWLEVIERTVATMLSGIHEAMEATLKLFVPQRISAHQ